MFGKPNSLLKQIYLISSTAHWFSQMTPPFAFFFFFNFHLLVVDFHSARLAARSKHFTVSSNILFKALPLCLASGFPSVTAPP